MGNWKFRPLQSLNNISDSPVTVHFQKVAIPTAGMSLCTFWLLNCKRICFLSLYIYCNLFFDHTDKKIHTEKMSRSKFCTIKCHFILVSSSSISSIAMCFIYSPTATWKEMYFLAHWAEVKTRLSFSMTPLQKPVDSELFRRACDQQDEPNNMQQRDPASLTRQENVHSDQ